MTPDDLVISTDSHTHSFIDLKPWLPKKHHHGFDAASDVGRRIFFEANRMWGELLYEGGEMHWEMDRTINTSASQYNLELTLEERLRNVAADGIAAEFLIDGNGPVTTDGELLHEVTLAYNRWFEEYVAPARHRFAGAVVVNLLCGIDTVREEILDAHAHGLAAIHLSGQPHMSSRDLPPFSHSLYDPMWSVLDELGMAVVFHGGVGREKPLMQWGKWGAGQRGWEDLLMMEVNSGNFEAMKHLMLASVPERYPNIRFGWIETGSHWIPPLLKELDAFMKCRRSDPATRMNMSPSEMWHRQCFTAGPLGPQEIALLDRIGVDNMMFGADYIHPEGTYPNSRQHLDRILQGLPPAHAFAVRAGNAARVLGFDLERLMQTASA
ncbi:MAG: amidohydrolase family protein [Gammaproteobacteria bacterium]